MISLITSGICNWNTCCVHVCKREERSWERSGYILLFQAIGYSVRSITMYARHLLSHALFVSALKRCCHVVLLIFLNTFPFHSVFQNYVSGVFNHKQVPNCYVIFFSQFSGLLYLNLTFHSKMIQRVSAHFLIHSLTVSQDRQNTQDGLFYQFKTTNFVIY